MMNQNKPRYTANFTNQNQHFSSSMSSRFHFQSNQGNPNSRKPYINTQSGLSNSNDTIISEKKQRTIHSKLEKTKLTKNFYTEPGPGIFGSKKIFSETHKRHTQAFINYVSFTSV